jgi:hypothetical protein
MNESKSKTKTKSKPIYLYSQGPNDAELDLYSSGVSILNFKSMNLSKSIKIE